jgi:hypothetical protein
MGWRKVVDTTQMSEVYVCGVGNHAKRASCYSNAWRLNAGLTAVASKASVVLILFILLGELAGAKDLHAHVTHKAVLIK